MSEMTKDESNVMWLTAISSINITYFLISYLHMSNDKFIPKDIKLRANQKQFKRFCKLNCFSKKTFFEMNSYGVRYLFKEWSKMPRNGTIKDQMQ
jgi:hypothetical protein